ncbi:hypothetical protein F4678DRAFT_440302 [Xylaria arbuscula]|nr:hypothetical protein F4678DRAFT_440302 [Xylaria arbuscula]
MEQLGLSWRLPYVIVQQHIACLSSLIFWCLSHPFSFFIFFLRDENSDIGPLPLVSTFACASYFSVFSIRGRFAELRLGP